MSFNKEKAQELSNYLNKRYEDEDEMVFNSPDETISNLLKEINITTHGFNDHELVYTFNWLEKEACEYLINLCNVEDYEVNEDEPELARIPEVVLAERFPEVYCSVVKAFFQHLVPIIASLTGHYISEVVTAQLAVYEDTNGVAQGVFHTDLDGDISVTVALNDDYEGGGFEVSTGGVAAKTLSLPAQPQGTASVFKGRTYRHRGLPVTKGKRYLLVFWCTI